MTCSFIPRAANLGERRRVLAPLTKLPISKTNWAMVADSFYLPRHIIKVIQGEKSCFTSISCEHEGVSLQMYTVRTPKWGKDTFALASTHFKNSGFAAAVAFGCSEEQINEVEDFLNEAGNTVVHPLLSLAVCAKLQLTRQRRIVNKTVAECLETRNSFEDFGSLYGVRSRVLTKKLRNPYRESSEAESEVKMIKRQLATVLPLLKDVDRIAGTLRQRLDDAIIEMENMVRRVPLEPGRVDLLSGNRQLSHSQPPRLS